MRTPNGKYPQYHTSADDLSLVKPEALAGSLHRLLCIVRMLEKNRVYLNLNPKCEPQLGRRGLYRLMGGTSSSELEEAILWVLNQSDGTHSLLDIAERSKLGFDTSRRGCRGGLREEREYSAGKQNRQYAIARKNSGCHRSHQRGGAKHRACIGWRRCPAWRCSGGERGFCAWWPGNARRQAPKPSPTRLICSRTAEIRRLKTENHPGFRRRGHSGSQCRCYYAVRDRRSLVVRF